MSLFKKFADYCRNSNSDADRRYRNNMNQTTGQTSSWRLEACSTCYYLRETDAIQNVYHPSCYFCERRNIYIHQDLIAKKKCDKYLEE